MKSVFSLNNNNTNTTNSNNNNNNQFNATNSHIISSNNHKHNHKLSNNKISIRETSYNRFNNTTSQYQQQQLLKELNNYYHVNTNRNQLNNSNMSLSLFEDDSLSRFNGNNNNHNERTRKKGVYKPRPPSLSRRTTQQSPASSNKGGTQRRSTSSIFDDDSTTQFYEDAYNDLKAKKEHKSNKLKYFHAKVIYLNRKHSERRRNNSKLSRKQISMIESERAIKQTEEQQQQQHRQKTTRTSHRYSSNDEQLLYHENENVKVESEDIFDPDRYHYTLEEFASRGSRRRKRSTDVIDAKSIRKYFNMPEPTPTTVYYDSDDKPLTSYSYVKSQLIKNNSHYNNHSSISYNPSRRGGGGGNSLLSQRSSRTDTRKSSRHGYANVPQNTTVIKTEFDELNEIEKTRVLLKSFFQSFDTYKMKQNALVNPSTNSISLFQKQQNQQQKQQYRQSNGYHNGYTNSSGNYSSTQMTSVTKSHLNKLEIQKKNREATQRLMNSKTMEKIDKLKVDGLKYKDKETTKTKLSPSHQQDDNSSQPDDISSNSSSKTNKRKERKEQQKNDKEDKQDELELQTSTSTTTQQSLKPKKFDSSNETKLPSIKFNHDRNPLKNPFSMTKPEMSTLSFLKHVEKFQKIREAQHLNHETLATKSTDTSNAPSQQQQQQQQKQSIQQAKVNKRPGTEKSKTAIKRSDSEPRHIESSNNKRIVLNRKNSMNSKLILDNNKANNNSLIAENSWIVDDNDAILNKLLNSSNQELLSKSIGDYKYVATSTSQIKPTSRRSTTTHSLSSAHSDLSQTFDNDNNQDKQQQQQQRQLNDNDQEQKGNDNDNVDFVITFLTSQENNTDLNRQQLAPSRSKTSIQTRQGLLPPINLSVNNEISYKSFERTNLNF